MDAPPATAWDRKLWRAKVEAAEKSLDQLAQALRNEPVGDQADDKAASRREHFSYTTSMVRRAEDALRELDHLLRSTALAADESRVLLVTGQAGTGKSHLLAAEANRAVAEGRPALLFLGQQFAQGHPWDQCEQSLGLPSWLRDELFGALDAAGEAAGACTMIDIILVAWKCQRGTI